MRKSVWARVIVVVLLCVGFTRGVAMADLPNLEDVGDQYTDPEGGWSLHVSLSNMSITSVPNMAATAFTREAYISATAEVSVVALRPDEQTPPGAEVLQRSISLWLQQGCQAKLDTTTLSESNTSGGNLAASASATGPSISPSLGETNNPQVNETLHAGEIIAKNLQNKAYPDKKPDSSAPPKPPPWVGQGWSNDKLTVSIQNWDLKYDSCAGPVSFRFIGEATMSTPLADHNVDAFSAIVQV